MSNEELTVKEANERIRLGYHRVSDDSVNSAYLTIAEANERISEMMLINHYDVDHIWTRDDNGQLTWEWRRELDANH